MGSRITSALPTTGNFAWVNQEGRLPRTSSRVFLDMQADLVAGARASMPSALISHPEQRPWLSSYSLQWPFRKSLGVHFNILKGQRNATASCACPGREANTNSAWVSPITRSAMSALLRLHLLDTRCIRKYHLASFQNFKELGSHSCAYSRK